MLIIYQYLITEESENDTSANILTMFHEVVLKFLDEMIKTHRASHLYPLLALRRHRLSLPPSIHPSMMLNSSRDGVSMLQIDGPDWVCCVTNQLSL